MANTVGGNGSYPGGSGGGGGPATIVDAITAFSASVTAPGTTGIYSLSVQPATGGLSFPVTVASLPLPAGAATAAKQAALGTAGTPSADVYTVQGAVSMTALKVDPSGVTSPVSIAATINNTPQVAAAAVSATNPMPTTSGQFARTDKSGTIAAGGTAQTLFAAGAITHGGYFQNLSTVNIWIRDDGTAASAAPGSVLVPANGGFFYWDNTGVPTTSVSIFCATTASAFTCKVW